MAAAIPRSRSVFLTNFAPGTIVHRRDHFRAERILQDRLFKTPRSSGLGSAIDEICGTKTRQGTHVRLKNVKTGGLRDVPADGVFIAIAMAPPDLVQGRSS